MQSEDFDKRVRDAAENHHPQYNERAWNGMEKLLNKHMPVEKDRRRFAFFILLAVLLIGGGTAWMLIARPWDRDKNVVAGEKTVAETKKNNDNQTTSQLPSTQSTDPGNTQGKTETVAGNTNNNNNNNNNTDQPVVDSRTDIGNTPAPGTQPATNAGIISTKTTNPRTTAGQTNGNNSELFDVAQSGGNKEKRKRPAAKENVTKEKEVTTILPNKEPVTDKGTVVVPPVTAPGNATTKTTTAPVVTDTPKEPVTDKDVAKTEEPAEKKKEAVTKAEQKKKNQPKNSLAFTVSGGGDISSVRFKNGGKMQSVFGAGFSYSFRDKLVIRSGFYTGHKLYTAMPGDYKVAAGIPTNYLVKINADCQVYEIPLGVAYNFGKAGGKQNVFAATSLSTFLMKEENYDYVYEYPAGVFVTYPWDYKDKNKHIFSVLTLSAGYTRNLGKRISLSAEPYAKIPLTGIGQGRVKLNNMGVLFTISTKLTGVK
jgi:hypothetical protein